MMSKTHLFVGMATALALSNINTPADCVAVLAGGAVGGVLADVDILKDDYKSDALMGELFAIAITAILVGMDFLFNWGVWRYIIANRIISIVGVVGMVILWAIGFAKDHRTFTHSIIAMLSYSLCATLIYPRLGIACMLGYMSHLLLDILNKKKIQLFYPLKGGICFGWCYANKAANKIFMFLGLIAMIILLVYRIVFMLS